MSRKKKRSLPVPKIQPSAPKAQPSGPRFAPGSEVRVRAGVVAPEFQDIPLGGWIGKIIDVDPLPPISYLIEWSAPTLARLPSDYRTRCQGDGLVVETIWLHDSDLESASSPLAVIEQTAKIRTRPLSKEDQKDRVRAVFGLTSDDPLPMVTDESLRKYFLFLEEHLPLPMVAAIETKAGRIEIVSVVALIEPEMGTLKNGLLCTALKVEGTESVTVPLAFLQAPPLEPYQPFEDYSSWFWNFDEEDDGFATGRRTAASPQEEQFPVVAVVLGAAVFAVVGAFYGASQGAVLASMENAAFAVQLGVTLLGLCGGLLGGLIGSTHSNKDRVPRVMAFLAAFGMMAGALLGTLLAVFLLALSGTLLGGLVGIIAGVLLARLVKLNQIPLFTGPLGMLIGCFVQAWLVDSEKAWMGAWQGGLVGAVGILVLTFGLHPLFRLIVKQPD